MERLLREMIRSSDLHTSTAGASTNGTRRKPDDVPANVDFGRLVAARRTSLGLSQERLAARMGMSRSRLARIEAGDPPSTEALRRLGAALHDEPGMGAWRRYIARASAGGNGALTARRAAVGLAAAIAAALWISLIAGGERGVGIGLAIASMATLFLSIFMAARRTNSHVPAAIVGALWFSVIGFGLISSAGAPALRDAGDDLIDAVLAPLGAGDQGQDEAAGAVLGLVASGGGQSREAGVAQGATNLPPGGQSGRCASPRQPGRGKVLTIGILSSPWSGGVVSSYPSRACGPESRRVAIAGVRASSPGHGLYAASGDAPSADHGSSPGATEGGSPGAAQGGSAGADEGGSPGADKTVNVGNTVNTVGNTVNNVGNTVNNVGNTVQQSASGVGNVLKGLGG